MNRKKTVLFQLLFLSVVIVALFFSIRYWTMGPFRNNLIAEKEKLIRLSLPDLQKSIKEGDFQEPREIIGSITRDLRGRFSLLRVAVIDIKGRILSATESSDNSANEHVPEALACLDARESAFFRSEASGSLNLVVSDPAPGPCRGGVLITFSTDDINSTLTVFAARVTIVASLFVILIFIAEFIRFHTLAAACTDLRRGFSFLRDGIHAFEPRSAGGGSGQARELVADFKQALTAEKDRDATRNLLIEKSKALAIIKNRDELYTQLFTGMKDALKADQQILMEINDDTLVVAAHIGYPSTVIETGAVYLSNEDIFSEALEFGRPLIIDDPSEVHQNPSYRAVLAKSGNTALLPLTLGNDVVGLLHVSRNREKGLFSTAEMEHGAIITGGAAVALLHGASPQDLCARLTEQQPAVIRHFREAASLTAASIPLGGQKGYWSEWFAFGSEKGNDLTCICLSSDRNSLRLPIRHKMEGMLSTTGQLRRQIGNLSLFSLSTLSKMKDSPEKSKLMELFKYSPFSVEGISELTKSMLGAEAGAVLVDVVRFDSRRKIIQSLLHRFSVFEINNKGALIQEEFPVPFKENSLYLVLPDNICNADDLAVISVTEEMDTILSDLRRRFSEPPHPLSTPSAFAIKIQESANA